MIPNMLEYYRLIQENNISIIYNGPIWADGVEGIGQTLRKRLEIEDLPLTISQSVFSVFIEQMYNILNYSADQETVFNKAQDKEIQLASGIFILGVRDKQYFVQCGNRIEDGDIPLMKERIDYLNTLDKDQLRKYYKEQLRAENNNPKSKGAGIGLIEIARRSSGKMEYSFLPMDGGFSFFSLYVTIG